MNSLVTARANAKVTLSLQVTGVRSDGMHELDAIAVRVDEPHDDLCFDPSKIGVNIEVFAGRFVDVVPNDGRNLVVRAMQILGIECGVVLTKGIPTEAGLGGGSADAAAVLRTFRAAANTSEVELVGIAGSLGADVAVCLSGNAARMRGAGDVVEPIASAPTVHMLIATPPFGCATPDVYRAWDELGGPISDRRFPPPPGWSEIIDELRNDLEPAALAIEPRLAAFRAALAEITGCDPSLCGSGSSYAIVYSSRAEADAAALRVVASGLGIRMVTGASSC